MNSISRMLKFLIGAICILVFSAVQAASISFVDRDNNNINLVDVEVPPFTVFGLALKINFSDNATSGGAIDIPWDPGVIQYNDDFAFSPAFTSRDPSFDVIDFQSSGLLSIGFGTLSTAGISDEIVIGTVHFTSGALGGTTLMSLKDSEKWSGFSGLSGGNSLVAAGDISVNYNATAVHVVPLPAAIWLMISGVGILGFRSKWRKSG